MIIQRLLYNQLHQDYLYNDVQRVLLLHTPGDIPTHTSAGTLSLNIYSKLVSYAGSQAFAADRSNAEFVVCSHRKEGLIQACTTHKSDSIVVMDACEAYVSDQLKHIKKELEIEGITLEIRPNQQFLISHQEFATQYQKPPVMESFYRWMRKKSNILMDGDKPEGGKRNYDKDNRKFDKSFDDVQHMSFGTSIYRKQACEYYKDEIHTRGKQPQAYIPVTRQEAEELLEYFVQHHLNRFGELEDAMYTSSDFVYHSLLSIPINFGLLTPQEVIQAIQQADTAINNKEGYIRQVLGWREYMHHRFHHYKNDIYEQNFFEHTQDLPYRFWTPKNAPQKIKDMKCVHHVLDKVERIGYSHHIERLMIIGNFCLLVGYDPHQLNKRFWEQYADAFERVVTPNVLGMSQYADGGNLATKPYIASANYVNKMSNYCKTCVYNPKEKYGEDACPLNYMYRNFVQNNKEVFVTGRQSFIVKHLENIDNERIATQYQEFISGLDTDEKNS